MLEHITQFITHQMHGGAPGRVGLHEELAGGLAKVPDLPLDGLAHDLVLHRLEVDAALVRQVVEHVRRTHGLGTCGSRGRLSRNLVNMFLF